MERTVEVDRENPPEARQDQTRVSDTPVRMALPAILLFLAVLTGSTAVIMIKASTEHPLLVAAYRLLLAALLLTPFFVRDYRKLKTADPHAYTLKHLGWSLAPAVALAVHLMSWVVGVRMTLASTASLLVNMAPLVLPFFLWIFYRERVTRAEVAGTLCALVGVLLLTGSSFKLSVTTFLGDLICLGSMLAYACYMALGRTNSQRISLWLYMVPLYYMAGIFCLLAALFFVNPIKAYTLPNILYIAGLAVIPTVFGHTLLNYSMKHFRGQVVGTANLGQVIFAGIMAAIFFQEIPSPVYYLSAALILAGILVGIFGNGLWQRAPGEPGRSD